MPRNGGKDERVGRLQRLRARVSSNREELQHLEPTFVRFERVVGQLEEAGEKQAFHTASKQEASQDFQSFLTEAERLATILLLSVKQHYGIRAEKLAEFGLKPFRGLKRNTTEPLPEPEPPDPEPTTETGRL